MLMRTDPFRDLDRVAQQVFGTRARPAAMPIDAYRHGEEFVVHFDLPGVDADSIDMTVERNVLTVHAQRERAADDGVEMLIAERPLGMFSRQLFLGDTLDADRIAATYANGVLTIRVPVADRAKPRRLHIDRGDKGQGVIETRRAREPVNACVSRRRERCCRSTMRTHRCTPSAMLRACWACSRRSYGGSTPRRSSCLLVPMAASAATPVLTSSRSNAWPRWPARE